VIDNIGILFKVEQAIAWFKRKHEIEKMEQSQKREAWIEYAIHCIIEQAKPLALNPEQVRRERYHASVKNVKAQP